MSSRPGCTEGTGRLAPSASWDGYEWLAAAGAAKLITCFSVSISVRNVRAWPWMASVATSSTLAAESRMIYDQSLGDWASYIGTYCAPSP